MREGAGSLAEVEREKAVNWVGEGRRGSESVCVCHHY